MSVSPPGCRAEGKGFEPSSPRGLPPFQSGPAKPYPATFLQSRPPLRGGVLLLRHGVAAYFSGRHRDSNPDLQHAELASFLWTMGPLQPDARARDNEQWTAGE